MLDSKNGHRRTSSTELQQTELIGSDETKVQRQVGSATSIAEVGRAKPPQSQIKIPPWVIIPLWLGLSGSIILFNKYLFATLQFPFPTFLTAYHMFFAAVGTRVLRLTTHLLDDVKENPIDMRTWTRAILPLGILFAISLVLANTAYVHLSVSFVQMLKASIPVLTHLITCALGMAALDTFTAIILIAITIGCVTAGFGELAYNVFGLVCQVLAVVAESVRLVMVQVLLHERKMNPLVSIYHYAPLCCVLIAIMIPFNEGMAPFLEIPRVGFFTLLCNGAVAFGLNVAAVFLIGSAGSFVLTLCGVFKDIVLITLSVTFLGSSVTSTQVGGYSIALLGLMGFRFQNSPLMIAVSRGLARIADQAKLGLSKSGIPISKYRNLLLFVVVSSIILSLSLFHSSPADFTRYLKPSASVPPQITDLLDTELLIRTPGASLLNQEQAEYGLLSMKLPQRIRAMEPFNITITCDSQIWGTEDCTQQYQIHFRGPLAYSLSPEEVLYNKNHDTGVTTIQAIVPQAGKYEVWAWFDYARPGGCPQQPDDTPRKFVRGSGQTILQVTQPSSVRHLPLDSLKTCELSDYNEGSERGRWVSLAHVRPPYRQMPWFRSHLEKSESLLPHTAMPDYIWVPFGCKRLALDYRHSLAENKDIKHLAFIGDSILRTSFCGHLYPQLHNGDISGACEFSHGTAEYHFSSKNFTVSLDDPSDPRSQVRFSQRFLDGGLEKSFPEVRTILEEPEPVTHVITNVGMWFAGDHDETYSWLVDYTLQAIIDMFGRDISITWMATPSVSPGVFCYFGMRRYFLSRHFRLAQKSVESFRKRYPDMNIDIVDAWSISDSRPETTSDGRHWVREGPLPNIAHRPMVGRADNAVMEIIWERWLLQHQQAMSLIK